MTTFVKVSVATGRTNSMDIPITQYDLDQHNASGYHIQESFPFLTADQREFLLSGTTPEEWQELFGEPEEEIAPVINPNVDHDLSVNDRAKVTQYLIDTYGEDVLKRVGKTGSNG